MRHIDHIELAWRLLGEAEREALAKLEQTLLGMARRAGRPEKYDAELTRAYFALLSERRRAGESWESFVARNQDLLQNGQELVLTHCSKKLC
jgi:hypothetical protein